MLNFLLDFFFPKFCLNCGKYFSDYLCDKCFAEIDLLKTEVCPVCEGNSLLGETHLGCKTKYGIDGMTVAADYGNKVVQKLIHSFKYQGNFAIADCLVERFLKEKLLIFNNHRIIPEIDFLTYVPLHPDKERKRGFNQSEILAKKIGKILNLPVVNLLRRMVYNVPQMSVKEKKDRRKNVEGIFCLRQNPVIVSVGGDLRVAPHTDKPGGLSLRDMNILLVDDVATTGATLFECVKVLKRNGAKFVWGIVVARKQRM
jgi:predicted amidophosphoribosyltransferase